MTHLTARQFLDSLMNLEKQLSSLTSKSFTLDRTKTLIHYLELDFSSTKIVHIAGTKAKGSIAAMTASLLRAAGYKVGLYTSPHIYNLRERIRILDNKNHQCANHDVFEGMISEEQLEDTILTIQQAVRDLENTSNPRSNFTFFEVLTVTALSFFSQQNVDCIVLETGLGGRLDATNALQSDVAVITPIGMDHMHILGDTIDKIAQEKAAIIKSHNQKVVVAAQEDSVRQIINARCELFNIKPVFINDAYGYELIETNDFKQRFNLTGSSGFYQVTLSMLGEHQIENALVSMAAAKSCLDQNQIDEAIVNKGLSNLVVPGRCEWISSEPMFLLDSAHTKESLNVLMKVLNKSFMNKNICCVFSSSSDKPWPDFIETLLKSVNHIILTKSQHARAADVENYYDQLKDKSKMSCRPLFSEAMRDAVTRSGPHDLVLVAGSFYGMSEARRWIEALSNQMSC